MSNMSRVGVTEATSVKLKERAKAAGVDMVRFLERLVLRGVILDKEPDGSFEDKLLSEVALRYDPTMIDAIRGYAEFRGCTPLELVYRHIAYGVQDGCFFE